MCGGPSKRRRLGHIALNRLGALGHDVGRASGIPHQGTDLVSALENLGYHRPVAEKAVDAVRARNGMAIFEDALKGALRELMR